MLMGSDSTTDSRHPASAARSRVLAAFLAAVGGLGCGSDGSPSAPSLPDPGLSVVAAAYLDEALDLLEQFWFRREGFDWATLRARALEVAGPAQVPPETYDAIREAVILLNDRHTRFRPPDSVGIERQTPPPAYQRIDSDVGYIRVPSFLGVEGMVQFATDIQHGIETVDTSTVCGWIVDLRGNLGGNMWPMVAGLGPLVGEGVLGSFVYPDSVLHWYYLNGATGITTDSADVPQLDIVAVERTPYRLPGGLPPVAVLTDSFTASSGEATTVSFRGRPDTRFFGGPTWGASTDRRGFELSDGARLFIANGVFADRDGVEYGSHIVPDEAVADSAQVVPSAAAWLRSQPACTS